MRSRFTKMYSSLGLFHLGLSVKESVWELSYGKVWYGKVCIVSYAMVWFGIKRYVIVR